MSDYNKKGANMNNRTMEYGWRQNTDYVGGATFWSSKWVYKRENLFNLGIKHSTSCQPAFWCKLKKQFWGLVHDTRIIADLVTDIQTDRQILWHHIRVCVDCFLKLNLLPPYSLLSKGDKKPFQLNWLLRDFVIRESFLNSWYLTKSIFGDDKIRTVDLPAKLGFRLTL